MTICGASDTVNTLQKYLMAYKMPCGQVLRKGYIQSEADIGWGCEVISTSYQLPIEMNIFLKQNSSSTEKNLLTFAQLLICSFHLTQSIVSSEKANTLDCCVMANAELLKYSFNMVNTKAVG